MDTCSKCGAKVFRRMMDNGNWSILNADGEEHIDTCSGAWLATRQQRDTAIKRHQNAMKKKNEQPSPQKRCWEITGDTYHYRIELKRYGCQWNIVSKTWLTDSIRAVGKIKNDFPMLNVVRK